MKKLLTSADAVTVTQQHTQPCSDCPWSKESVPGWLGPYTAAEWLDLARGEQLMPCHTRKFSEDQICQCAGAAIFRRNICKLPRNPEALKLEADREKVFAHDGEFIAHHSQRPFKPKE